MRTFDVTGALKIVSDYENNLIFGDSEPEICFDGKWFRSCGDFLSKAEIDGQRITLLCNELYGFEVI